MNKKPAFTDVYSFIRDRYRQVAQDFIILSMPDDEYYIKVSKTFFTLSSFSHSRRLADSWFVLIMMDSINMTSTSISTRKF